MSNTISKFIPLVDFLGAFFGENCEVVLHDVRERENSILAISNSKNISGRQVGAPLTDLALKFVMEREHDRRDWVMGYTTLARNGSPLHSATYFIREEDGELAGMLCLNMSISELVKARDIIDGMISIFSRTPQNKNTDFSLTESFSSSVEDLTENIIRQVVNEAAQQAEHMSPDEKIELVRTLHKRGVFLLKGSVHSVAQHLATSEPTIYRYLQKVNSGG
ncbi:MAG: PAS domain-containing protein [Desulfuromusa sp.]|nr:PAS domain-containing protein [Desulfuromusa sp.]